nr:MAG TPA: hypothetical protein [Caudoviricetes sp.]
MDNRRNLIQVFCSSWELSEQEGTLILRWDLPLCGYRDRPDREQCMQRLIQPLFDHFSWV